ncbi:anthranilate phosphoribosyltransferase [Nitrosomonas cryotolerans]|uniref:Anthranilate phosphoribosyltransferase n=1 Tax=Nitrosomonas cryotolerans ATCC 49181 TaxID=1131553 RepID=A0A1N6IJS7_9PROT|nr:anthranilate phosphoribosyltransferase [Nitrosomonas cryotolerans]SFP93663.1 anthranilate phosphoribosyltransferase [Nitrosomonas cryotolerans]SIO32251.1 anthranilate phosphoribosyltransferase [Nitrosomonas cryotolerans ATCC 49181]
MKPQEALNRIIERQEILHDDMLSLMRQIMLGELSPVLVAAILTGLRVKKETIDEITAAAQVMREFVTPVTIQDTGHLIDTCGTGGDASHTFNISTASAFVAAAAGAQVAKHGGRSVSSKSGSADILEAVGVNLKQTPEQVAQNINEIGVGFMFAPNYHSAMQYVAPVRRELGIKTLFNILGPLTNPAGAKNQVLGVFNTDLVGILTRVLQRLGSRHVMVVNGQDGLDEITITGETRIGELNQGNVIEYIIRPEDFGLQSAPIKTIQVSDSAHAKAMLLSVLEDQAGPARDIVILNAAAAIYVAGVTDSLEQGVKKARLVIENGSAMRKLQELVKISNQEKAITN